MAEVNRQVTGVIAESLVGRGECAVCDASVAAAAVRAGGGVIAAAVRGRSSAKCRLVPALPTMPYAPEYRPKVGRHLPIPACVAKPVSRKIQLSSPMARAAMDAEWDRLRKLGTWDEVVVREWADVAKEARQANKEVHFGYLLGLFLEKGSELPEGHPDRKFNLSGRPSRVPELGDSSFPGFGV